MNHTSLTHGSGESYCGIVPAKQPNKGEITLAEAVEGRPQTQENTQQPNPYRTPSRENGLERVLETSRKDKELRFTALFHHVTTEPAAGKLSTP